MKLSELKVGESVVVQEVVGDNSFKKRLVEMGFVKGQKVELVKMAPLQDPVEYTIMGYNVSLRKMEADNGVLHWILQWCHFY